MSLTNEDGNIEMIEMNQMIGSSEELQEMVNRNNENVVRAPLLAYEPQSQQIEYCEFDQEYEMKLSHLTIGEVCT
jgi:hypothetical protein